MELHINEYSFSGLFGEHYLQDGTKYIINEIEIPIIQRDYAQGRKTDKVERVRTLFLDNIYQALISHRRLTLDFVYGEVKDGKLIPLDGQQRLTTLFLLHWYASKVENIHPEEASFLKGFSYYTRPSSRDFCKALLEYVFPKSVTVVSNDIRNQAWFQYHWNNDPTISSMLVMIDAIHERFARMEGLWHALINEQLITFYFLPLDKMGLSDDLYIKMNSRGKPLTRFEHFKAEFEGMIAEQDKEQSERINKKFDLDWTDMLFPYRGENEIIDDEFMRYFFFVSDLLCYQQNLPVEKDEFRLSKRLYSSENPKHKDNLFFLEASFDCWCRLGIGKIDDFFERHFSRKQYVSGKTKLYQDEVNLFRLCCDNYGEYEGRNRKFTLNQTLMLYAVVIYLQNVDTVTEKDFQRRIRIVRNLVWNSSDEIRADGQRNNMPNLLEDTKSIVLYGEIKEGVGYNQMRKSEERQKNEWLLANPDKQDNLFHLEDHNLLYGCVQVVGLENSDNFDKFRMLFDNCDRTLISKALMVYGDYSQGVGWDWQLGTRNDSTWESLFHPSTRREGFERTKETLNMLLAKYESFDDAVLEKVVSDYLNDKSEPKGLFYYFVKYPIMLSEIYGMYYTYEDGTFSIGYHTLKLNARMKNGKSWNVFLLALNNELGNRFELGNYAYQGDCLYLSEDISLDCEESAYVLYRKEGLVDRVDIDQDKYGLDTEDRVVRGIELIRSLGF